MKRNFWKGISAVALMLLLPAAALAHSGGRDIRGTIASFTHDSIVVKRVDGKSETVPLASTTEYRVGSSAGSWDDLHDGSRVVVHIGHDGRAIEVHLPSRA
jgi:hypothetical protein